VYDVVVLCLYCKVELSCIILVYVVVFFVFLYHIVYMKSYDISLGLLDGFMYVCSRSHIQS